MAINKVYKFKDIQEAQTFLNGGLIGASVARGIRGLVGQTLTLKAPGPSGSVTFIAALTPTDGDSTVLRLADIKSQIENAIAGIDVVTVDGRICLIETSPTAGVTVSDAAGGGYARVVGNVDINSLSFGPGGTLDTLELTLKYNGGADLTVTFTAPANRAAVLTAINAITSPSIVASIDPLTGYLILTSAAIGDSITVVASTALAALGLSVGVTTGAVPNGANAFLGFDTGNDSVSKVYTPAAVTATPPCWANAQCLDQTHIIYTWE